MNDNESNAAFDDLEQSARLAIDSNSQRVGISKSPKDSQADNLSSNYLLIPNKRSSVTMASGDYRKPPLIIKTGSTQDPIQSKELELFPNSSNSN